MSGGERSRRDDGTFVVVILTAAAVVVGNEIDRRSVGAARSSTRRSGDDLSYSLVSYGRNDDAARCRPPRPNMLHLEIGRAACSL